MPRNVSDIYYIPPGTEGFPDTTIESEKYNNYIHDVETDLNRPRPISSGGTGADDADEALANLHAEKARQVVTNFDSHVWMAGSFYSTISATAPPVALHAFSGIAHITDADNMVVHAVDLTDPFHTPWSRVKTAGVWGTWIRGSSYASIISADDPPASVPDNTLWFESSTGLLYIRYNDGDTTQWTIACPQPDISTYAIKDDVDTAIDGKVAKSGDTMTGHLSLPVLPSAENAVRKDYVDSLVGSVAANLVINGDFRVNQTGYVSATVLSAGTYGHDQWKAGASGGDYSFTQLKSSTQITIASGKSLIQPIEDVDVVGGSYVLSWIGTAQARAGVNTLTPSGSYAGSPLLITGQTAGTVMSVEFNSGTLGSVKLESGTNATPFVMRAYDQELLACKRYLCRSYPSGVVAGTPGISTYIAMISQGTTLWGNITFPVEMRTTPAVNIWGYNGSANAWSDTGGLDVTTGSISAISQRGFLYSTAAVTLTVGALFITHFQADARL